MCVNQTTQQYVQRSFRCVRVFELLPLFAPSNDGPLRWHVTLHLQLVPCLVLFGHLVEALLFFIQHCLGLGTIQEQEATHNIMPGKYIFHCSHFSLSRNCIYVSVNTTYLPPFCTFARKFRKYNLLLRVLLLMLLAAGLYEEGVRCHAPPRLIVLYLTARYGTASHHFVQNNIILNVRLTLEEEKDTKKRSKHIRKTN